MGMGIQVQINLSAQHVDKHLDLRERGTVASIVDLYTANHAVQERL